MKTDYLKLTLDDLIDRPCTELIPWMEVRLAVNPDIPGGQEHLELTRRQIEDLRVRLMTNYATTYAGARDLLDQGESPDAIEGQVFAAMFAASPALREGDPILRLVRAAVADAIAGITPRTEFDPAWDLTKRELDAADRVAHSVKNVVGA
jgi:hypothetical protein